MVARPIERKYTVHFDRYVEKLNTLMSQIKTERTKADNKLEDVLGPERVAELQKERDWFCAEALRLSRELKQQK